MNPTPKPNTGSCLPVRGAAGLASQQPQGRAALRSAAEGGLWDTELWKNT